MQAVRDDGVMPVITVILLIALTVIFAVVTGAAFLSMTSSVGSAKIVAVSAEAGNADSPVFIHLTGGRDLEELVKVYAYDGAGNNFAVTKDGAVFSPGLVLDTEQVTAQSGGLQRVSLTGEFADGTKQFLWEGELTLVEGGEIVWVMVDGPHYMPYPDYKYRFWLVMPYKEDRNTFRSNFLRFAYFFKDGTFSYVSTDYSANTLVIVYIDTDRVLQKRTVEISDAEANKYKSGSVSVTELFDKIIAVHGKIKIESSGRVSFDEDSNQVFKPYP